MSEKLGDLENFKEVSKKIKKQKQSELPESRDLYARPGHEMIQKIMDHNEIGDYLLLSGELSISPDNKFGFFRKVLDSSSGKRIYYPNGMPIDDIFISKPKDLDHGERYYFEVVLAKIVERKKYKNPYLLQTTTRIVQKTEILSGIAKEIGGLKRELKKIEREKDEKKNEVNEIKREADKRLKKANEAIDFYNEKIRIGHEEKIKKEKEIEEKQNELLEISNQKIAMEQTIQLLKDRLELCKNLEFIKEQEEEQYLSIFTENGVDYENHLSFESDLDGYFSHLVDHVHHYLYKKKNLIYTKFQIRNFLTLLRTHDLVVLSGLSGSGKTQIVKAFAEALGGVAKIIPVKPNWTSSDDLLGYYNPIQMSFLPTPFTEAIVEAIHNPHQLYFICLDEMNLARVEYYFADFLSKLEERSQVPEIELYSKHEEELFVSEFNNLLNFIESSIQGVDINSWQDFIENEEIRNRFFELLGNADKESLLQLHAKMKRRLIDILKFPSTLKIPNNIRFIGAINVDETTHYFSPKILDRVHIVKFDNPLLHEKQVGEYFHKETYNKELKPVYVTPEIFANRTEYPQMYPSVNPFIADKLKEINQNFLLKLNIDFGIRSIRQSLNYSILFSETFDALNDHLAEDGEEIPMAEEKDYQDNISLNGIILQKILPRLLFDSSELAKNGESKLEILKSMKTYLGDLLEESYNDPSGFNRGIGKPSYEFLSELIQQAENNPHINFFA